MIVVIDFIILDFFLENKNASNPKKTTVIVACTLGIEKPEA